MTLRRRLSSMLSPFALAALLAGAQAKAREIWLAPQASVPPSRLAGAIDFMDMFKPDAPWKLAAYRTHVFKLYGSFLAHASQDQIDAIVGDLKRRKIAIAVEVGVIDAGPGTAHPPCGGLGLVEGYGTPEQAGRISRKIKDAGGTIAYIAMDEPLWHGHYFGGRAGGQPGCKSGIGQIARLIVPTLKVYAREFPGVAVGDIEPTNLARLAGWQNDLLEWAKSFRGAMAYPMAFIHLDIPWHMPNAQGTQANITDAVSVYRYAQALQANRLVGRIGIIFNGARDDRSDAAWMDDARNHILLLERTYGLRPDQAIVQSWTPNPTHAMPDSSSAALTSLVDFYSVVRK